MKTLARIIVPIALIILVWKSNVFTKNEPQTPHGAELRRNPLPKEAAEKNVLDVETILFNHKANRLNARRDATKIQTHPTVFGPDAPFRPLFIIRTSSLGEIIIKGDGPTGSISFPTSETPESIEVYPHFNLDMLKRNHPKEEIVTIQFIPNRGTKSTQMVTTIPWSEPNEIFLSSQSLHDLAALIQIPEGKEWRRTGEPQNAAPANNKAPEDILGGLAGLITEKDLYHETDSNASGWQLIRDPNLMTADKRANCLDLSLLTAQTAVDNGLEPYLIVSPGHALCAVGKPNYPAEQALLFEGTNYLKGPAPLPTPPPRTTKPKPRPTNKPAPEVTNNNSPSTKPTLDDLKKGKTEEASEPTHPEIPTVKPKPAPPKNEDLSVYQIQLKKWMPFYRH
jgi:hypothetical protein